MDLRKTLDKVLSTDIHEAEMTLAREIDFLGKSLFNKTSKGCGNCLIEIYIMLHKQGKQKIMQKEQETKRVAQLNKNVLLVVPQMGIYWTNESPSFTDSAASKALKAYPNLAKRFKVLPPSTETKAKKRPAAETKAENKETQSSEIKK